MPFSFTAPSKVMSPGLRKSRRGPLQAEDVNLPDAVAGGTMLMNVQQLEHELLELRMRSNDPDSVDVGQKLTALGEARVQADDLEEARLHLAESLRIQRSVYMAIMTMSGLPELCVS